MGEALYPVLIESLGSRHFFTLLRILPRNRYAALLLRREEIKIDSAAPAVDGPVQNTPSGRWPSRQVSSMCHGARSGRVTPVLSAAVFHFRRITLNPAVNRGVIDIHSRVQLAHLLRLTVTDAVFASTSVQPTENDVTLKMPAAFEWVHVQLHPSKGMISLSPPTICNSADKSRNYII